MTSVTKPRLGMHPHDRQADPGHDVINLNLLHHLNSSEFDYTRTWAHQITAWPLAKITAWQLAAGCVTLTRVTTDIVK